MSRPILPAVLGAIVIAVVAAAAFYGGRRSAPASASGAQTEMEKKVENAANSTKGKSNVAAKPALARTPGRRMLDSAVSNPSARAPLPAAGTPLKSVLADLKARADAGDADAASRLFKDMQTCAQVQRLNQMLPTMASRALNDTPPGASAQRSERMLDFLQRDLDFTKNNAAMCADLSADDMASLVPATLEAAQLGDPEAANCYVGANLNNWPGLLDNPQWVQDYQTNALNLANSALQQGDWSMAMLMAQAYGGSSRNLLNQLTGSNAQQAYTYAKLMSLGQPSGTQPSQRSTNALSNFSSQLTADQIQAADAQAQQMYQQYFNSTPRQTGQIANATQACQGGPGF
ncbi:MAG: hypothetical protein QM741_11020 [Rudaea sp.]|uniref:hypothetical protein n=1 Tax=Rudaea sp. TaxID=2136325 RepID=UPI0039E62F33